MGVNCELVTLVKSNEEPTQDQKNTSHSFDNDESSDVEEVDNITTGVAQDEPGGKSLELGIFMDRPDKLKETIKTKTKTTKYVTFL